MKHLYLIIFFFMPINLLNAQSLPKTIAKLNLVYKTENNWEGKLDFYQPMHTKKVPLIIYIHGGGWTHGNKEAEFEKFKVFIENGYAVANVEYRLANQAPAPAAIQDVNSAIMYLLADAKALNFDPNKIVLMGGSAGAHLALLTGLQAAKPIYTNKRFKVAAMISKYGPTNLQTWEPATKPGSASASWLGDRVNDTAFLKSLSPINYAYKNKIPVLFIHGDEDKSVPLEQSETLYQKLLVNGSYAEIYVVNGGKHGNFGDIETAKMDKVMLAFLAKQLEK
ncbi:MAG: alpha/beta hydrolase [Pedobacter sp.]|nr:MAG: alpha/beta hydrolase [Pedobacter sp.]